MLSRFARRMIALLNRTQLAVVPARSRLPRKRQGAFRPRLEILEDRTLPSATLPVSVATSGTEMGNNPSSAVSVSANGQYALFTSNASDLVSGVTYAPFSGYHVLLRNLSTGTTRYVDVASNGTTSGDDWGYEPSMSPDGRYVVFLSRSDNLTSNGSGRDEVYVRDMFAGQTFLVSLGTDGKPANSGGDAPTIAEDGRGHLLIAYGSNATTLTSGDSNRNNEQIFLASLNLDSSGAIHYGSLSTKLVSADNTGTGNGANGDSYSPTLSHDGSTLDFTSKAANLNVPGGYSDNDRVANLYRYSLANQTLNLLDAEPTPNGTTTTTATANEGSSLSYGDPRWGIDFGTQYQQSLSTNGQFAVFTSGADNLVPGLVINGSGNIFLRNLATGTTSLVSASSDGTGGDNSGAGDPVVTPDGRYVAFVSDATNLNSKAHGREQVYVRDMQQGQTYLVSLGTDGNVADGGGAHLPGIAETSNGQLVISFESGSTNLTANDTNSTYDQVFVTTFNLDAKGNIESNTLSTRLASADSTGNGGNGDSNDAILSSDGSTLAFESYASNLPGETADNADGKGHSQVFVYNVASGALTQVSPTPPTGDSADSSSLSGISDNGQYLAYLYRNNTTGVTQVLAWNANTGTNTVIDSSTTAAFPNLVQSIISGDGSTVAFRGGNVFGNAVIYAARNWQSGVSVTQISPSPHSPTPGDSSTTVFSAESPSISDNGQIIAYQINPYEPKPAQLYVYNFNDRTTTEISAASSGGNSNGEADTAVVSGDGSTIIFNSGASNLVPGMMDFASGQVYAFNVGTKTVSLVSAQGPGVYTTDGGINGFSLSDNGDVVFASTSNDLQGNLNGASNVFAESVQTTIPTLISVSSSGLESDGSSGRVNISGDGSTIAFQSNADNLVANQTLGGYQIYSRDWLAANPTTTLVSVNSSGAGGGNQQPDGPIISANGQIIAFYSYANNLTSNDANAAQHWQAFARNLGANTTSLVSSNSAGTDGGNNDSYPTSLSADGSTLLFNSDATDLVSGASVPSHQQVFAYLSNPSAPVVTSQPSNQTVTAGGTATFRLTTSGSPNAVIQWLVSSDGGKTFSNISGATGSTLTLSNVQFSQSGNEYQAVFTNIYGTVSSNVVTLTVDYAPIITTNPSNQTVRAGQNAGFTAAANGNPTPKVQWQVSTDGGKTFTNISGATSTTLTLNNVTLAMNGTEYQAVFSNSAGSIATSAATLAVNSLPPSPPPSSPPSPPPSSRPTPPSPSPAPVLNPPPLLASLNSLLGGVETVNPDGTETITDSFFGIPLFVSTFDSSGNLVSVDLFGIDVTFLFLLL